MRLFAMTLCALAASTLNAPNAAHSQPPAQAAASAEERLPHISVEALGSGKPVVLIPGLSTPREVWSQIAPELAKSHRVLLVQVNGFAGDNPGANAKPGILDGIVADIHTYLASHHLASAPVVGHSMGGLVAMKLALAHPRDVGRLMIVDSLPFAGTMFDPAATVDAVRPLAAMLKTKMEAGYTGDGGKAAVEATASGLTAKPESKAKVTSWVLAANPKVAAEAMAEDLTTDLRPEVGAIAAPITLVHPSAALGKDAAATDSFYRTQYAGAKRITFVPVADSGHFVMLDQPEDFAAAVRDFLK